MKNKLSISQYSFRGGAEKGNAESEWTIITQQKNRTNLFAKTIKWYGLNFNVITQMAYIRDFPDSNTWRTNRQNYFQIKIMILT